MTTRKDVALAPIVSVQGLRKEFPLRERRRTVTAVDGVTLEVRRGQSLGIVGESGSGKTTLARCLLRLIDPSGGSVVFDGVDLVKASPKELRALRARFQAVFQDPYDSLDPRWRVAAAIEEPLKVLTDMSANTRRSRVAELLEMVHLDERFANRYPHQLSGGQQQRVSIARALATQPELLVLDEPTSALDALVRVEILDLLNTLRRDLGLTYVYISHDIASVRRVCDQVAVMYMGAIVERGPVDVVVQAPLHPYTKALMSAVLDVKGGAGGRRRLTGEPPSVVDLPSGCRFHTRCPVRVGSCATTDQQLVAALPDHEVACMRVSSGEDIVWPEGWGPPPGGQDAV